MTMLEKMAQAIYESAGTICPLEATDAARVALLAIREPSLAQVWAIDSNLANCSPDVAEGWRQEYRRIWRDMVDAILAERD